MALLTFLPLASPAATVTGSVHDISVQGLNTKLLFAPTTNVLLTPNGLSAGPPKTIDAVNGQFSLALEAGDYTVSLPLIPWRRPFSISVFDTNGVVNITNLLSAPNTYTYTNNLNWLLNGTNLYFTAGKVGIGTANPAASLEVRFDSAGETPKQLLLSATDGASAVGLEFQSPNSASNWQAGIFADAFKIGKQGIGNFLTLDTGGLLSVSSLALAGGTAFLNGDGSASFLSDNLVIGNQPVLHVRNASVEGLPTQLRIESTDAGAVGIQFYSPTSSNNWQISLVNDALKIGKADVDDFLLIDPTGLVSVTTGYAVGAAAGISTNLAILLPGPRTNTLIFTKGILTNIQ